MRNMLLMALISTILDSEGHLLHLFGFMNLGCRMLTSCFFRRDGNYGRCSMLIDFRQTLSFRDLQILVADCF